MDVDKDPVLIDTLNELGFESAGKISYFHRVVTSRPVTISEARTDGG
jgi:hypothetical protein